MIPVLPMLLLAACAHHGVRDRGLAPSATTAEALDQALSPRRLALVIGVDSYVDPTFPRLRHAADDATAMAARLGTADGGFDEVKVLSGSATRAQILAALRAIALHARREDALVVYFSGHGTRVPDASGAMRRYLLASDTKAADLGGTALDLGELELWLSGTAPLRKALIVDACFQGGGKGVLRPGTPDEALDASLVPRATAMGPAESYLFATSAGRPAREDDRLGHGVYTSYLLDALSWGFDEADRDADGVVTAFEAHDYARGRTITHTAGAQVPEAAFRVVGEADLVLAGDPQARARSDDALVYLYGPPGEPLHGAEILVDGRNRGVFPGTVAIDPGMHHLSIQRDGVVLAEGSARLGDGEVLGGAALLYRLRGPEHLLAVRPMWTYAPTFSQVVGPGTGGLEVGLLHRAADGPQRGLYESATLGFGLSPGRDVPGGGIEGSVRPAVSASGTLGYQTDLRRLRLRGGLGLSAVIVPPADLDGDERDEGELGWWLAALGPTLGAGWTLRDGWAIVGEVRPHAALLDLDGDGTYGATPWLTAGVGFEVAY